MLILSARRSVDDRVAGLRRGGDDYLTKPFSFTELLARVQALVRRSTAQPETTKLAYEDVELDLLGRRATRAGEKLELQPKEFALLEYLLRNADRVVSKTVLLEHVYDYGFDPQTNVVDESGVARMPPFQFLRSLFLRRSRMVSLARSLP